VNDEIITIDDVEAAAGRLREVAHRTPVIRSRTLDELIGVSVLMKAETLQRGGSFKLRGAYNRISAIEPGERARGVLAFSSGNHAQGVAIAAAMHGIPATIVMPDDSPANKLAATRGYGAEIVLYDRFTEDREGIGRALAAELGLTLVHPFDDPLVMAGQGTVALELIEEAGGLDLLLAPVGGGGLLAGCATVMAATCPDGRTIGVEPEAGDDHQRSFAAGRRVSIEPPRTIADALRAQTPES
jgi:threonine dehydratase